MSGGGDVPDEHGLSGIGQNKIFSLFEWSSRAILRLQQMSVEKSTIDLNDRPTVDGISVRTAAMDLSEW